MMTAVRALMRNRSSLIPVLTTLLVGGLLVGGVKAAWPADPCDAGAHRCAGTTG